jgi:hypothetical protein
MNSKSYLGFKIKVMKKRYLVAGLFISSALLAAIAQNTQATMSGLLLGLRQDNPKTGRSSYRTLWIASSTSKDVGAKLQAQAPGILVARDDGWWRVGVARETIGAGGIDVIFAHPASKPGLKDLKHAPVVNCSEEEYDANFDYSETILFVGSKYISHEKRARALKPCSHYGSYNALEVNEFSQLQFDPGDHKPFTVSFTPENIKLSSFGQETIDAQNSAWLNGINALSEADSAKVADQKKPEDDNWGVVRRAGSWMLRTGLNSSLEKYVTLDVAPETLQAVVGAPEPEIPYQVSAKDWVFSPNKDLMAILKPGTCDLYKVWGGKPSVGKISSIVLKPNEAVIMAQWAVGDGLKRWIKEVPKLLR